MDKITDSVLMDVAEMIISELNSLVIDCDYIYGLPINCNKSVTEMKELIANILKRELC